MFGATFIRNKMGDRNDVTLDGDWFSNYKESILSRYRMQIDGRI